MAISSPKRRQTQDLPVGQANFKSAAGQGPASLGLALLGADGNAQWMRDCVVDWPSSAPACEFYDGDAPNFAHSFEHRLRHQVPHLKRQLAETLAPFAAEWWISIDPSHFVDAQDLTQAYKTVVHFRSDDKVMEGALKALRSVYRNVRTSWATEDTPEFEFKTDLPTSSIPHELVIETILPARFAPGSLETRIGGCWFRATRQAVYIQAEVARALRA